MKITEDHNMSYQMNKSLKGSIKQQHSVYVSHNNLDSESPRASVSNMSKLTTDYKNNNRMLKSEDRRLNRFNS
jgi:hypothetical protein